jgi:hypothetical protein
LCSKIHSHYWNPLFKSIQIGKSLLMSSRSIRLSIGRERLQKRGRKKLHTGLPTTRSRQRDRKKRALKQLPLQRLAPSVHLPLPGVALILPTGSTSLNSANAITEPTIVQKLLKISPNKIRKS